MPFAASVAATAIATASYCVTNGAHVNRAHAATDTHDEVRESVIMGNAYPRALSSARATAFRASETKASGLKYGGLNVAELAVIRDDARRTGGGQSGNERSSKLGRIYIHMFIYTRMQTYIYMLQVFICIYSASTGGGGGGGTEDRKSERSSGAGG